MKVTIILDCWRGQATPARLQQALNLIGPWQFHGPAASTDDPTYSWLSQMLKLSSAREVAALMTDDQSGRFCYEATPCHWQISVNDVALVPVPPPSLPESEALIQCANDALDGAARIEMLSAGLWGVRARFDLECGSIVQTAGRSIRFALPAGDASNAFKRVLNTVQMAWFQHPVNLERELRGMLPINAFWLMGGRSPSAAPQSVFDSVLDTGLRSELLAQAAGLQLLDRPGGTNMLAWLAEGREAAAQGSAMQEAAYTKIAALISALPTGAHVDLLATGPADLTHASRRVKGNPMARWIAGFRDVDALAERLLA
jgi:hypothetical protein